MSICSSKAVNEVAFSYYPQLEQLHEFCQEHFQKKSIYNVPRISAGSSELILVPIFALKSGLILSAGSDYCGSLMPSNSLKLIIGQLRALPTTQALTAFQTLNERSSAAWVWHQSSTSSWWNPASSPIQISDNKLKIFVWYCPISKE